MGSGVSPAYDLSSRRNMLYLISFLLHNMIPAGPGIMRLVGEQHHPVSTR